jgi:hypothetical protein
MFRDITILLSSVIHIVATMNKSIPPAIMKLEIVIPKMVSICVPATANTNNRIPVVIIALEVTVFLSFLERFLVNEINNGTTSIGSITTNKAIVEVIRLFTSMKSDRIVEMMDGMDEIEERRK